MSQLNSRDYIRGKEDGRAIGYMKGVVDTVDQRIPISVSDRLPKDEDCWDYLYPYCGWTSNESFVPFQMDVPLSHTIGDYIKNIITALEEVGVEDQRIVFWFDN